MSERVLHESVEQKRGGRVRLHALLIDSFIPGAHRGYSLGITAHQGENLAIIAVVELAITQSKPSPWPLTSDRNGAGA